MTNPDDYPSKGTTMEKNYQTKTAPVVTAAEVAMPERVTDHDDRAGRRCRGRPVGSRGGDWDAGDAHDHERVGRDRGLRPEGLPRPGPGGGASRHRGRVGDLGRPAGAGASARVRTADGAAEVPVASYELFSSTEILGRMAMERTLAKLATRRYGAGLVGVKVDKTSSPTSRSAVSAGSWPPPNGPSRR